MAESFLRRVDRYAGPLSSIFSTEKVLKLPFINSLVDFHASTCPSAVLFLIFFNDQIQLGLNKSILQFSSLTRAGLIYLLNHVVLVRPKVNHSPEELVVNGF